MTRMEAQRLVGLQGIDICFSYFDVKEVVYFLCSLNVSLSETCVTL